jgi:hypothetical protein
LDSIFNLGSNSTLRSSYFSHRLDLNQDLVEIKKLFDQRFLGESSIVIN